MSRRGAKQRARVNEKRRAREEAGIPKRCPVSCPCLCHETGGGVHTHPGEPCPTKLGKPVIDDWVVDV